MTTSLRALRAPVLSLVGGMIFLGAFVRSATAQLPMTLNAPDASIELTATQKAIDSWKVTGVEHLEELSNWFRIGSSGPEASLHPYISSVNQTGPDTATIFYTHPQFQVQIDYAVTSGSPGSGYSTMGEQILITNTTATPLPFHFFEYVDLDLTNTPGDDVVTQFTASTGRQFDAITQVNAGIINCDGFELAFYPTTLNKLSNATTTNLGLNPGYNIPVGPGDVTWTLQWNFDGSNPQRPIIAPFGSASIVKLWDLQMIVPEPTGGAVTAVLAVVGLCGSRRRTRSGGRFR